MNLDYKLTDEQLAFLYKWMYEGVKIECRINLNNGIPSFSFTASTDTKCNVRFIYFSCPIKDIGNLDFSDVDQLLREVKHREIDTWHYKPEEKFIN